MDYIFFYLSMFISIVVLFFYLIQRRFLLPNILIGIASVGYSLINDNLFGNHFKLFYYISPQRSAFYMILAAIFIYSTLNMIYTAHLPENFISSITYTIIWIIGMLIFEYLSVAAKTIVFTGWSPFPWSILLYIVSYLWIYNFYKYLLNKMSYVID